MSKALFKVLEKQQCDGPYPLQLRYLFPKCGLRSSSKDITWELVSYEVSRISSQTYWIRICILRNLGGLYVHKHDVWEAVMKNFQSSCENSTQTFKKKTNHTDKISGHWVQQKVSTMGIHRSYKVCHTDPGKTVGGSRAQAEPCGMLWLLTWREYLSGRLWQGSHRAVDIYRKYEHQGWLSRMATNQTFQERAEALVSPLHLGSSHNLALCWYSLSICWMKGTS